MNNWSILCATLGTFLSVQAFAQKPPLDHDVYDNWKSIGSSNISKSGNFLHYAIVPQEGDAVLELKDQKNNLLLRVPRGDRGTLTTNDQFFVAGIKPMFADVRQAKIKKKKADDMPKDSLLVFGLKDKNQPRKFANVKSYKLARNSKEYVAFIAENKLSETKDSLTIAKDSTSLANKTSSKGKGKTKTILHLLHLPTGDTTNFEGVDDYFWRDDEQQLLMSKKGEDKDSTSKEAGLYLYSLKDKSIKKISNGKGSYKSFNYSDDNAQLSFVAFKGDDKTLSKEYKLYYYTDRQDTAQILAQRGSSGMPKDWWVSGDASLDFSADGNKLYLGLAPIPLVKDTALVEFEHAKLDIWHWKDDYLQPQQLVNLKRDQARSFSAVIYPKNSANVIPLSDETFNRMIRTDLGNEEWVLVTTDFGNRIQSQWDLGTSSKVYKVSTKTGKNELIIPTLDGQVYLSPKATHAVYFDRKSAGWYSLDLNTGDKRHLNQSIEASFVYEENDMPMLPGSYGVAGWSEDGKTAYIYDRYDVWAFPLDGKSPSAITNGYGRENKISLRLANLDRQDNPRFRTNYVDLGKTQYMNAFNEVTKENGMYILDAGKRIRNPRPVLMAKNTFRRLMADEKADRVIYTKEDYTHSPDLYVNSIAMNQEMRLTDINPQQATYNWGTAELVEWTTPKGHAAEGILYKPEDFDPNKKYPIIAYFYEKLSDGLYSYQAPAPTPSRLNIPYFVSNGYLVFAPDIEYETGYPGQAAEEFINSGMRHLARTNSWVDSTKMGIQGQSWGGYQVAHLITRTDMYAAAWTGAPVVNMTSAYGGIRWGSGMSRQFQYENTQSRIGQNLWEARDLYIENSPLFFLDRVTTPVVIMHNDQDGAVPWYQGIEMFTALRRLQKPVWLLNYNGDDHNLTQRQNRKDIQRREVQFFDHYLKGKPAAVWIKTGVPAIKKGIQWGLEV